MEILLGKGFFGETLLAMRDGGIFPSSVHVAEGFSVRMDSIPELIFRSDLKVGLKFNVVIHVGDKQYNAGETTLFFNFGFSPVRQSDGYVSGVTIRISFDTINNSLLDMFLSTMGDFPVDLPVPGDQKTPAEWHAEMIDALSRSLHFEFRTNLVVHRVQDVQIHTLENPCTLGIYVNFIMRKDPVPKNIYPPRGDLRNARNLLNASTNIGIFSPATIYPMLTTEIKTTVARKTDHGKYEYPILQKGSARADLKAFLISSAELISKSPFTDLDPDQLLVSINTRFHIKSMDGDANGWMTFRPKIVDGRLSWDVTNLRTHINLDWEDKLKIAFIGGIFLSIFAGFPALPITTALLYGGLVIAEEILEGYADDLLYGAINDSVDNLLGSVPTSITVAHKREDPFYETQYQVAGKFEYAETNKDGMAFLADTGHQEIHVPCQSIALRQAARDADNQLAGLVYSVPKAHEIINPEAFIRPNPEKQDEFMLTLDEIDARRKTHKIRHSMFYVTPTHVMKSRGKIQYIKFDDGIYLTPHEAGTLQQMGIIGVTSLFKRIYMKHRKQFYYRARADRYTSNNLAALPSFEIPSAG